MMRCNVIFCLCLLGAASLLAGAQTPDAKMTTADRAKALQWLKDAHAETLALVEKLSDAQWKFKAAPEKWSVGECVEHIMLAEGLLFGQVEKALAAPVNPAWQEQTKGKAELIENIMVKRLGKANAPEAIVPMGKLTRAELMKKLRDARAQTIKFTTETQASLLEHTTEHPFPVFKTLNAYQWLIYIPLHNLRHNQQIAEVKANANFPKE